MTENLDNSLQIKAQKKKFRKKRISSVFWYQFVVIRAASMAALIILGGYLASVFVTIQGIQSISKIAFDKDIGTILTKHLANIKEIHELHQEILIGRLQTVIPPRFRTGYGEYLTEDVVKRWLKLARFEEITDIDQVKVRVITPLELDGFKKENIPSLHWISKSSLRIYSFLLTIPAGKIKEEFRVAEELKMRYQGIMATWSDEVRPTLIALQLTILLIMGFVLIGSLLYIARRFKKNIDRITQGFVKWSEVDSSYRFDTAWSGELRIITEQFNQMADEVETNRKKRVYLEKMASWQIIARKLAHEIKNPLTPIQMMVSQVMRKYNGNDPDYRELLKNSQQIIVEEVNGLRRMVDNFSKFASLPEPKVEMNDLVAVCYQIVELQKATFSQHNIRFVTKISKAHLEIDAQLIKQALANFIKNAAEACGEKPSTITLTLLENPKELCIEIYDDGPGIPSDLQKRIFEAYFTTKHTGPSPGMGLGLAICQKIIIDHDGDVSVVSKPGKTRFLIKLPKNKKGLENG